MKRALILAGGGARGAFQVGVLRFLEEMNWKPDLICGTSVGGVNAVGMGCGMKPAELAAFWKKYNRRMLFDLTLQKFILSFLSRRKFKPLMDTQPLRTVLEKHIDIEALRRSRTEIIITAVNMRTSAVTYFDRSVITIGHLLASGAIPLVFPWQFIDGEPYWDGGIMANVPIMPALERGAKEIIIVLLSPVGWVKPTVSGANYQPLPQTHSQVAEMMLEHFLFASGCVLLEAMKKGLYSDVKIATVAPTRMLGLRSLLNFSSKEAERLIREGYDNARDQLRHFFKEQIR
jgi:NTE family protein